jgi:hypothetical protein
VELGINSAYYDSEGASKYRRPFDKDVILKSNKGDKITEEISTAVQTDIRNYMLNNSNQTFKATIKVTKMDPLQKEYSLSGENGYNRNVTLSYLKVISVPTNSDIDFSAAEPDKNNLILDYIDDVSYEIERQELESEKDKIKLCKIDKLNQAIKSIHVHINVSEVCISF